MSRIVSSLFPLLAVLSLSSCTLENFEVEPCDLGDTIGFRIATIDGWFRDYQPQPAELTVRIIDNRSYEDAVVWATRLTFDDFDKRTPRKAIAYGQKLPGWEIEQPPKALSKGLKYSLKISDGGHHGWAEFEIGKPMSAC